MNRLAWAMGVPLLLSGCDTNQTTKVLDNMGKLRGAHAARGGVILDGGKGGDWQISRCDEAPDGSIELSAGDAEPLLTVRRNDPKGATLRVPGGATLIFHTDQCRIVTKAQEENEQIRVDCTGGNHELLAGVTTLKCGG